MCFFPKYEYHSKCSEADRLFQPLVLTKGCENHQQTLSGFLKRTDSQADEGAAWTQPVLTGIVKARCVLGQKQKGQKECWALTLAKLTIRVGMLLVKMSLSIPWTCLIHPRNHYIHSLIHCILQRLPPLIHVIFMCSDLSFIKLGFHLSLCMFSILDASEGSCNSQIEGKDKVALILITLQSICCIVIIPTASMQMLDRKGDQHRVLLHIASGNP